MKKTITDNFLEFCFKLAKILSAILLILSILVLVCSSVFLINTYNQKSEMAIPQYQTIIESIEKEGQNISSIELKSNKTSTEYNKEITEIFKKAKLDLEAKSYVDDYLSKLDSKNKEQYIKGLEKFCHDGLKYLVKNKKILEAVIWDAVRYSYEADYIYEYAISNIKKNGIYNYYITKAIISEYNDLFSIEIDNAEKQNNEKRMIMMITGGIIILSIIIFLIFSFLPLLIKIEENTRKKVQVIEKK